MAKRQRGDPAVLHELLVQFFGEFLLRRHVALVLKISDKNFFLYSCIGNLKKRDFLMGVKKSDLKFYLDNSVQYTQPGSDLIQI